MYWLISAIALAGAAEVEITRTLDGEQVSFEITINEDLPWACDDKKASKYRVKSGSARTERDYEAASSLLDMAWAEQQCGKILLDRAQLAQAAGDEKATLRHYSTGAATFPDKLEFARPLYDHAKQTHTLDEIPEQIAALVKAGKESLPGVRPYYGWKLFHEDGKAALVEWLEDQPEIFADRSCLDVLVIKDPGDAWVECLIDGRYLTARVVDHAQKQGPVALGREDGSRLRLAALSELEKGHLEVAGPLLRALTESFMADIDARILYARVLMAAEDHESAAAQLAKVLEADHTLCVTPSEHTEVLTTGSDDAIRTAVATALLMRVRLHLKADEADQASALVEAHKVRLGDRKPWSQARDTAAAAD